MGPLEELFRKAAEDRRHGAGEIEHRLVQSLLAVRAEWTTEGLGHGGARLCAGQPAMANLRNLSRRLAADDLEDVEAWLRERARTLAELPQRLGAAAWPHLEPARRVVTLSRSSAVAAVLTEAFNRGWQGETVVLDGSPAGGGVGQAECLSRSIGRVRSQPDAAAARWLDGNAVRVVIGADAVGVERVLNACGTAVLLELAAARSVPVVLVADTGKDLPEPELELLLAAVPSASGEGPGRRWPLFEVAPLARVSERVHE